MPYRAVDSVNAGTRWLSSFHHQAREERLGDLTDGTLLFVRGFDGDKFALTLPAVPKVMDFSRIDGFIPFKAHEPRAAPRAYLEMLV